MWHFKSNFILRCTCLNFLYPYVRLIICYNPANNISYRMAGNFRGSQFSRFSRLTGDPRKLNPRNKRSKRTRARAITGGVASWCMPLLSWIELTAGLLHTSSLLLGFFCISVSSFDHNLLSCRFSISSKYKYDRSIACCFFSAGYPARMRKG